MKWQALPLVLVLCWSCKKDQSTPPPAAARPAPTPAQLETIRRDSIFAAASESIASATARRDSALFKTLADSMSALETMLRSSGNQESAAPILLKLGRLKEMASRWMTAGRSTGVDYAKAHSDEYGYFDPDGRYYYNGRQWRDLLTRFPQSSLADSARWYLAHMERGHGD